MPTTDRFLRGYLIVTGLVLLTAAPCAFLPYSWMNAIHEGLGLGTLPDGPMTMYLARSASALYASIGPLYLYLAHEPRIYTGLLRLIGVVKIVLGAVLLGIDLSERLPWFWIGWEGPFVMAWGVGLLVLVERNGPSRRDGP